MVKRAGYVKFHICSVSVDTPTPFEQIPQYIIISTIIFIFLFMICFFSIIFYYIHRKFNSIDNHTNKKYNNPSKENTYKEDKEIYEKDVSSLEAKILPNGQTVANVADKIIEIRKNK